MQVELFFYIQSFPAIFQGILQLLIPNRYVLWNASMRLVTIS